jgi:hypothetical protein
MKNKELKVWQPAQTLWQALAGTPSPRYNTTPIEERISPNACQLAFSMTAAIERNFTKSPVASGIPVITPRSGTRSLLHLIRFDFQEHLAFLSSSPSSVSQRMPRTASHHIRRCLRGRRSPLPFSSHRSYSDWASKLSARDFSPNVCRMFSMKAFTFLYFAGTSYLTVV